MEVVTLLPEAAQYARAASRSDPTRPRPPYFLRFPRSLVKRAEEHLRQNGRLGLEQLVLWGGFPTGDTVVVASLLLPETEATWGWVHVLPGEQPAIAEWLHGHGQLLFAEAHTHGDGPRATEISAEDRRHPAGRQPGFLTIIVPGYARDGIDIARAGLWQYRGADWVRLGAAEAGRIQVISDEEARRALD